MQGDMRDALLAVRNGIEHLIEAGGEAADFILAIHLYMPRLAFAHGARSAVELADRSGDRACDPAAQQDDERKPQACEHTKQEAQTCIFGKRRFQRVPEHEARFDAFRQRRKSRYAVKVLLLLSLIHI